MIQQRYSTVPLWKLQSSFPARCNSANISCNPCQTRLWVVNKCPLANSTIKMIPKDIFIRCYLIFRHGAQKLLLTKNGEVVWAAWKPSAEVWWWMFYFHSRTWSFNVWTCFVEVVFGVLQKLMACQQRQVMRPKPGWLTWICMLK